MNKTSISETFSSVLFRIPLSEKILFAKHLSMMIKAGMTESESLKLIRRQVQNRRFAMILDKVIERIENGQFLSESLNQFKNSFGDLFINLIKVGELSGTLADNLDYLALEIKKSQALKSKVRSALIYPIVLLVATLGLAIGMIFFILPKILPIFMSLKIKLPLTTRILIGIADILKNYYFYIIIGIFLLVIAIILLMKIHAVRYVLHRMLLSMPLIGRITIGYNVAIITRTLGLLLKSGIKIVEAVSITSTIITNLAYRESLVESADCVKRGESLYKYLEEHPGIFPPTFSRMIEVGEKTGNLDSNLTYLGEFYENEVDEITKNLSSTLEPILLLIMGIVVGFIALAIITPIYGLTQNLKVR